MGRSQKIDVESITATVAARQKTLIQLKKWKEVKRGLLV